MDVVNQEDLEFKHPFSMLISGSRETGKTHFTKQLILKQKQFISKPIDSIHWFAPSRQHEIIDELKASFENFFFHNGLPKEDITEFLQSFPGSKLIVIDDLMEEAGQRKDVKHLFTRGRHENISVILLSQNDFHQSKHYLEMSRNTDYPVIFKNVRNAANISIFARQMGLKDFLPKAFKDATREAFSYLLLDTKSNTPEHLRFRSKIFNDYPIVYASKSL